MRFRVAWALPLLLVPLSGCVDVLNQIGAPDYHVSATPIKEGQWNRDNTFRVLVQENATVRIEASQDDGTLLVDERPGEASLTLPDGTWDITYWVGGHKWNSFSSIRIDTTPPSITGLETVGDAVEGSYELGAGATVDGHVALEVIELRTGARVSDTIPVQLAGLDNGLQAYLVSARDEAGNHANVTVQVHVGTAADLPEGRFTFGVVARYTNTVRVWDISRPSAYHTIEEAQAATGGRFLGDGYGITTRDSSVERVVRDEVTPDMNTMEVATALYRWFADNLEYDELRLESETLLTPHQVLLDTEDAESRDCTDAEKSATPPGAACDGLVMDGAGNGVLGGICRDLAATYVSLLRAAGVPARLVSGYVAGNVNGFHAWAEFYGGVPAGLDQSPWIPVDVSNIDGPYKDNSMLQAFGLELPEYLPLRFVPEESEIQGWSTALSVQYQWPQGAGLGAPDVRFRKDLATDFTYWGALCVNPSTKARMVVDSQKGGEPSCPNAFTQYFPDFVRQTERTIDYGIEVVKAPKGTNIKAEVAYPFEADVEPDRVVYEFYGPVAELDSRAGKALADFWPSGR